jgi:hypothetical protein
VPRREHGSFAAGLAVAGVLILFTLPLTRLAVIPVIAGLSAKTVECASAVSYPLIFLPFISSAFRPPTRCPARSAASTVSQAVPGCAGSRGGSAPGHGATKALHLWPKLHADLQQGLIQPLPSAWGRRWVDCETALGLVRSPDAICMTWLDIRIALRAFWESAIGRCLAEYKKKSPLQVYRRLLTIARLAMCTTNRGRYPPALSQERKGHEETSPGCFDSRAR